MIQFGGNCPTTPACRIVVPFMNQMPTLPLIVEPENVGLAVAVEVSGSGDRPVERDAPKLPPCTDLRAVHQPHADIAGGVAPENVALAVAIEVALADDRPVGASH